MTIDPRNIAEADCIPKQFPLRELQFDQRPSGFQVVICRSVLDKMKNIGRKSMRAEVGGMLVGNVCWDSEPFVLIEDSIEGKYTDNKSSSVTFTSKTWDYVHEQIELSFPNCQIVGWNHTHPGFGIFLSGYDLFICRSTFNAPFHVAYVFDPRIENRPQSEGFFVWQNSRIVSQIPCIIENVQKERAAIPNNINTWKTNWSSNNIVNNNEDDNETQEKITITFDDQPVAVPSFLPTPQSMPISVAQNNSIPHIPNDKNNHHRIRFE
ncbi:MAG: hypothetical protein LBQ66_16915 [Planctomycetaceae bacterium]|jgi:proteasome lid subunit RPN8/RPN11|nr:hypothetical protein [Planctomycetaceae bacterium]